MSEAPQAGLQPEMVVTFFCDQYAQRKREERLTADQLAERIRKVSQTAKERLPWLKCARFGDRLSGKGSLRHDDNVDVITGVEADYDATPIHGGVISFGEAIARVRNAGIAAILYTSPSFCEELQKYRVLCPLSAEHPPQDRDLYMARLNGLFDGAFASESWTLSQSYFFGAVNHNPSHRVEVIDGICIDRADHLDASAIGRPEKPKSAGANGQHHPAAKPEQITDKRIRGFVESLLDKVRNAQDGAKYFILRDISFTIGGYLHLLGWTVDQTASTLVDALPDTVKDWTHARETARKAIQAGKEKPLDLEERPIAKAKTEPPEQDQPKTEQPAGRILTGRAFIASFVPPDWLIDGIVQRGRLYACTSLTGHGKTAVWSFNSCMIQAGRMIGTLEVCRGNVLFLAGENPEDLKARLHGMCRSYNLTLEQLPYVLPGNFPLTEEEADLLKRDIAALGVQLSLIVGDTASSFFPGDDENNNVQAGSYARTLRTFTQDCDGHPTVVTLCHPVKNASRSNLLPRGGGAFVNELDGNTTLWSHSPGEVTELHWCGKIRGPDFAALGYRLRSVETGFVDRRERPVMTIVADPMSEEAVADHAKQTLANEDVVLRALRDHPDLSMARIAQDAGWLDADGRPEKWKVQRAMASLADDKLIHRARKGAPWTLTEKGKEVLEGRADQ
jgi:AAA domain